MLASRVDSPRRKESPRTSVPALLPYTQPLLSTIPWSSRTSSPRPGVNGSAPSPRVSQNPAEFSSKPPKSTRQSTSDHQEVRTFQAKSISRELSPTSARRPATSPGISVRSESPSRYSSPMVSRRSISPSHSHVNAAEVLARLKGRADGEGMAAIVNDATHTISLGMGSHKLRQLKNQIFGSLGPKEIISAWKYDSEMNRLHRHLYQQLWVRSTRCFLKKFIIVFKICTMKRARSRIAFAKLRMRSMRRALAAWCHTSARLARFSHLLLRCTFSYMRNYFRTWKIQTEIMLKFPHYVEILQAIIRRREVQDTAFLFHDWQSYCHRHSSLEATGRACMCRWDCFTVRAAIRSWFRLARQQRIRRQHELACSLRRLGQVLRRWNLYCRNLSSYFLVKSVFFRNQQVRALRHAVLAWLDTIFVVRMRIRAERFFHQKCLQLASKKILCWYRCSRDESKLARTGKAIGSRRCRRLATRCLTSWMQYSKLSWNRWRRLESHRKYHEARRISAYLRHWLDFSKGSTGKLIEVIRIAAMRINARFGRQYFLRWNSVVRKRMIIESSAAKKTFLRACRLLEQVYRDWNEIVYTHYQMREKLEELRAKTHIRNLLGSARQFLFDWKAKLAHVKTIRMCEAVLHLSSQKQKNASYFAAWRTRLTLDRRRQKFFDSLCRKWIFRSQHAHFRAWFLKYRFEKNLLIHVKAWNAFDTLAAFNTWCLLVRNRLINSETKMLPKSDFYIKYRRLRKWQYVVDLRKSIRLRVGLFEIRSMHSVRLERSALQSLSGNREHRKQQCAAQDALSRRILRLKCRNTTSLIRDHAIRSQGRRKSLWIMMNRLAFSLMKWGWLVWRTWMKNKKRTQQALQDVMDDF